MILFAKGISKELIKNLKVGDFFVDSSIVNIPI
jgi:hypothetical protein